MAHIFEITDKKGRKIHLSSERWKHLRKKHPEVEDLEQIKETIEKPDKIITYHDDVAVHYYYKYYKKRPSPENYLLVVIKYLNGGDMY